MFALETVDLGSYQNTPPTVVNKISFCGSAEQVGPLEF